VPTKSSKSATTLRLDCHVSGRRITLALIGVTGAIIIDVAFLLDLANHGAAAGMAGEQTGKGEVVLAALGFLGVASIQHALNPFDIDHLGVIEHAERFGLAQLHQLRGRIGRGEHKSYCILLTSAQAKEASAKLAVLERTSNGFEVAEADWELRGPGDLLGTAQSGLPALKIGNLKTDAHLMRRARAAAVSILERDPRLELPENQRFRRLLVEQQGRTFSNVS